MVFHVFYVDVFHDVIDSIRQIAALTSEFRLIVTTVPENREGVQDILSVSRIEHIILTNENCGRDILPFIKSIPVIKGLRPDCIIKTHTKKSTHRSDGAEWFKLLSNDLISVDRYFKCCQLLSQPGVGVVSPSGNLVPSTLYIGSNVEHIQNLLERFNGDMGEFLSSNFVAGSMFVCGPQLLDFLEALDLEAEDFEEEHGQVDGTLAHAIERIIAYGIDRVYSLDTVAIDDLVEFNFAFAQKS